MDKVWHVGKPMTERAILWNNEWYHPTAPGSMYEPEYQRIVLAHADTLFPNYMAVPFTAIVESTEGVARPDMALIDHSYRHWWVVEVELQVHSLYHHVVPQVRILVHGDYTHVHAQYLLQGKPALDASRLSDMLKGVQPRVLVVADGGQSLSWKDALQYEGSRLQIVEVYRNRLNDSVLCVEGSLPAISEAVVSLCRPDPVLPKLLEVQSPGGLQWRAGETVRIWYNGGMSDWTRVDSSSKVWLLPLGANPLRANRTYALVQDQPGLLRLREQEATTWR